MAFVRKAQALEYARLDRRGIRATQKGLKKWRYTQNSN